MLSFADTAIGAAMGGILSPIILAEYQRWRHERSWAKPRKKLLLDLLNNTSEFRFRSIERLSLVTGTTKDECRTLLMEVGARGARLSGNREGWALVSKAPLGENLQNIENNEKGDL